MAGGDRKVVVLTGDSLTIEDVVSVALGDARVSLSPEATTRLERSRAVVERVVQEGRAVYGVNTGFGALCGNLIPLDSLRALQLNLVRSHASGVGEHFQPEVVRAAMLVRANSLCRGCSGVRPVVVDTLVAMLNRGVTPAVPSRGSLGASGDLAPLAHLALVLIGEGKAWVDGQLYDGRVALARAGLKPLELETKEGLALLNGTAFMTGLAVLACYESLLLLEAHNAAAALSLEAFGGRDAPYSETLVALRPHAGAIAVADHLRRLLRGSRLVGIDRSKVQDPYSFRCVPQVHGAALDALVHSMAVLHVELNSATDNPVIVGEEVLNGGNFHGQPVGSVMDYLSIALTAVAAMAERRVNQLLHPGYSGLPAFLAPNPGLQSGLMIAQYTAASLVSEMRVLSNPASVQSISVCADQEDHVSMGTFAAAKTRDIVQKALFVAAIELLAATQALDLRLGGSACLDCPGAASGLGVGTHAVYRAVRGTVPFISADAPLNPLIERLATLIREGELRKALRHQGAHLQMLQEASGASLKN
jgi:histidine ammonia-lyase